MHIAEAQVAHRRVEALALAASRLALLFLHDFHEPEKVHLESLDDSPDLVREVLADLFLCVEVDLLEEEQE